MKHVAAGLSLLSGLAAALPAQSIARQDIVRTLPRNWKFTISSLKGPGCPDFGVEDGAGNERHTRLTYGQNTMDGSEIYHWFIAFPSLRVELGKTESVWCEAEIDYAELKGYEGEDANMATSDYRLRLHKNATQAIWSADLESGAKATLSFTYQDIDKTDTVTLNGPTEFYHQPASLGGASAGPVPVAKCGATKLKFRTELTVSGTGTGVVHSAMSDPSQGDFQYYGTQLGFSYDWEKCAT